HDLFIAPCILSILYQFYLLPVITFFYNATSPTEIYTLSLHDALPIWPVEPVAHERLRRLCDEVLHLLLLELVEEIADRLGVGGEDRKSTRLNSSHVKISYAVFCLKKKKKKKTTI